VSPRNTSSDAQGFRWYGWRCAEGPGCPCGAPPGEEVRVLSVTSIRRLAGLSFQLVEWQLANMANLATGLRRATWRDYSKSKRGRLVEGYRPDGPFPGEFVTRVLDTNGDQAALDEVRKWLRSTADAPRDVAAVRGSVVHKLIELNVALDRLTDDIIRARFDDELQSEKRKVKPVIIDEDITFVRDCMANYWDMRRNVPFVILGQETQCWNLTAGYAGSADVLAWFLPDGAAEEDRKHWQSQASKGLVTADTIAKVGGTVALGDWKTSKSVVTDHVIQMHAYLAAEFIGTDGKRDARLTALLEGMMEAVLFHIRPDGWEVDFVDFRRDVLRGFLGSVAFARLLATYPRPNELFTRSLSGRAEDTEVIEDVDAAA